MKRAAIILAGGGGTRLWPLSTEEHPKQFLEMRDGRSLLRMTWDRIARIIDPDLIRISTSTRHAPLVAADLGISDSQILTEPERRNTGPAIALASARLRAEAGDDLVVGVFPSDHWIGDEEAFSSFLETAFAFAETYERLVTLAIAPSAPRIEYGYLELGESISPGVRQVRRFVEKPDLETARTFLTSGDYAWNAGIFVWRDDAFLRELNHAAPEISRLATSIANADGGASYEAMPNISIDFALMERARDVAAVPVDAQWSDLGSWDAIAAVIESDHDRVHLIDSIDVLVKRSSSKPIVVAGVDSLVVIETDEGLLILDRRKPGLMKEVSERLRSGN